MSDELVFSWLKLVSLQILAQHKGEILISIETFDRFIGKDSSNACLNLRDQLSARTA